MTAGKQTLQDVTFRLLSCPSRGKKWGSTACVLQQGKSTGVEGDGLGGVPGDSRLASPRFYEAREGTQQQADEVADKNKIRWW